MFGHDRRFPVTGSRACERVDTIREVHSLVGHLAVRIVRGLRALAGLEPLAWWGAQTAHALTSIALRIDRLPEPPPGAEPRSVPSPAIRAWAEGVHPGWDPGYRERVQLALRGLMDVLESAIAGRELSPREAEYLAQAREDASRAGNIACWLAPLDLGVQAAARHLHQEESAAARAIAARAVRAIAARGVAQ